MFSVKKATVRLTIVNNSTATIQRLYDYGINFKLDEERLEDPEKITHFLETFKKCGGKETKRWKYVDEDDLLIRHAVLYEYEVTF